MYYRCLSFVFTLFLFVFMVSNVWATNAEDDCFFSWAEENFPTFIAPAGPPSQFFTPYYFRYYSDTNSYLGINSQDQHLYYLSATGEMVDLGSYITWKNRSGCQAAVENGPQDVSRMLNQVFELSETVTDSGLTDQMEPLLFAFMGAESTCPTVETNLNPASFQSIDFDNPDTINTAIRNLPNPITARIDYGTGCTPPDSPQMSGSTEMVMSNFNLDMNTGSLSTQFSMTANQLKENGTLLANGTINGRFNFNMNNSTGSATINLVNMQTATGGNANGTATVTISSATSYLLSIDVSDGVDISADIDLSVRAEDEDDDGEPDRYIINTTRPGTINQYTVVFNDVVFDSIVCENYPVGGSAVFSSGGESWTTTFDGGCDGEFTVQ